MKSFVSYVIINLMFDGLKTMVKTLTITCKGVRAERGSLGSVHVMVCGSHTLSHCFQNQSSSLFKLNIEIFMVVGFGN